MTVAGLGGNKHYVRLRSQAAEYWPLGSGFIFSIRAESGVIKGYGHNGNGSDQVLLTDRFFLGQPEIRGFDYRGIGPRIVRRFYVDEDADPATPPTLTGIQARNTGDDSLGGEGYYLGKFELEVPLGSGAHEMGLRPSIFMDVGSVFGIKAPPVNDFPNGSFPTLKTGIERVLWPLPPDTVVYPGHGPVTTVGHEKQTNPFVGESAR